MFKQKAVKVLALIVSLVFVVGLFAGCQKSETKTNEDQNTSQKENKEVSENNELENIEIEFMLLNNKSGAGQDFVAKKIIKDKFNIDVNFNCNTYQGHFDKLKLLVASNQLPDIVSPLPANMAKEIGPKGALVAIDKYLDKMPNFKKYLEADKKVYASLIASDEHIYSIPRFSPEDFNVKCTPIIRKDLVEEVNMEMPKTFDELYDVLKAIKEKHPETVGMVSRDKMRFIFGYGIPYGTECDLASGGMYYNPNEDKWLYAPLTDGFKELVFDLHKFWDADLMDKEFFTASKQQWEERLLNGTGVFAIDWASRANMETEAYRKIHPEDKKFELALMMPLTTKNNKKMRLNIGERIGTWTSYGISTNTKHLDRILQMVDYMFADEAVTAFQWGEEGKHYIIDEDGNKKYKENIKTSYNPEGTIDPENDLGLNHNRLERVAKDDGFKPYVPGTTEMIERYKNEVEIFENNYRINLTFTDEELEEINELNTNLSTMIEEALIKFITGENSLDEYDEYLKTLEESGALRIQEIYAKAYDQYKQLINDIK